MKLWKNKTMCQRYDRELNSYFMHTEGFLGLKQQKNTSWVL